MAYSSIGLVPVMIRALLSGEENYTDFPEELASEG